MGIIRVLSLVLFIVLLQEHLPRMNASSIWSSWHSDSSPRVFPSYAEAVLTLNEEGHSVPGIVQMIKNRQFIVVNPKKSAEVAASSSRGLPQRLGGLRIFPSYSTAIHTLHAEGHTVPEIVRMIKNRQFIVPNNETSEEWPGTSSFPSDDFGSEYSMYETESPSFAEYDSELGSSSYTSKNEHGANDGGHGHSPQANHAHAPMTKHPVALAGKSKTSRMFSGRDAKYSRWAQDTIEERMKEQQQGRELRHKRQK